MPPFEAGRRVIRKVVPVEAWGGNFVVLTTIDVETRDLGALVSVDELTRTSRATIANQTWHGNIKPSSLKTERDVERVRKRSPINKKPLVFSRISVNTVPGIRATCSIAAAMDIDDVRGIPVVIELSDLDHLRDLDHEGRLLDRGTTMCDRENVYAIPPRRRRSQKPRGVFL